MNQIKLNHLSIIIFTKPACPGCALLTPKMINYCTEQKINYAEFDVSTTEGLAEANKYRVQGVPAVIIKLGEELMGGFVGGPFELIKKKIEGLR